MLQGSREPLPVVVHRRQRREVARRPLDELLLGRVRHAATHDAELGGQEPDRLHLLPDRIERPAPQPRVGARRPVGDPVRPHVAPQVLHAGEHVIDGAQPEVDEDRAPQLELDSPDRFLGLSLAQRSGSQESPRRRISVVLS